MSTASKPNLMTAEESMTDPGPGQGRHGLVRGEVVELSQPRPDHGFACSRPSGVFSLDERETGFGDSLSNDSSLRTRPDPGTVRGPDVGFDSEARPPRSEISPRLSTVAPDVAIEVALLKKVGEDLAAGSLAFRLIDSGTRSVVVFRDSQTPPFVDQHGDAIEDQPELSGFRCLVSGLFP